MGQFQLEYELLDIYVVASSHLYQLIIFILISGSYKNSTRIWFLSIRDMLT